MASFLGLGTGGVFAWVADAPPERVGSVTGIVGAAGGLGGYFPPLVMGATYDASGPTTRSACAAVRRRAGALAYTVLRLSAAGDCSPGSTRAMRMPPVGRQRRRHHRCFDRNTARPSRLS